jgi:hypothetical protein
MVNISLILYTKDFFGSFLKSSTQMGSLSINNSVTNISRLGTFKIKAQLAIVMMGLGHYFSQPTEKASEGDKSD